MHKCIRLFANEKCFVEFRGEYDGAIKWIHCSVESEPLKCLGTRVIWELRRQQQENPCKYVPWNFEPTTCESKSPFNEAAWLLYRIFQDYFRFKSTIYLIVLVLILLRLLFFPSTYDLKSLLGNSWDIKFPLNCMTRWLLTIRTLWIL